MQKIATLIFYCTITFSFAQNYSITGRVFDASTKMPLEAATIFAESPKDSALISYTISDKNGLFELELEHRGPSVNVFVTYNGFNPNKKQVGLNQAVINIGDTPLQPKLTELDEVNVVADRIPITIKKDTLEFNADSFKTRPDATVEDILKKLPGVEIDNNGKITVNGKEVSQVLVNGQVFFSNDPTVATKSLPKEIISKIQILDTKTKKEEFAGDAGKGDTKTINLTIKEDQNKGLLGRLAAGYGTDERYQLNGLVNYFKDKERVSVIGSSNNINNAGFSFDEIYGMMSARTRSVTFSDTGAFSVNGLSFGFGEGITTSTTAGASYANAKKKDFDVGTNYFYTHSNSFNDTQTNTENILPDRSFFTLNTANFDGITNSHRADADIEFTIDPTFQVNITPSFRVNSTKSQNRNRTQTENEERILLNQNTTFNDADEVQRTFSNRLELLKKLDTLGTYFSVYFDNNNTLNSGLSSFNSLREVFGNNPETEELNQLTDTETKENSYTSGFTFRQHLVKKLFLEAGYEYQNSKQNNRRSVFDFNENDGAFTDFNTQLSSNFTFLNQQHRPTMSVRLNGEKLRTGAVFTYVGTLLSNNDILQQTNFEKEYKNLLFETYLWYDYKQNQSISIDFSRELNVPSIFQLQPVPNISNPLNIITGNPNLNPEISNNVYISVNNFDWKQRKGFFIYSGFNYIEDDVALVTNTNDEGLRTTTYQNVDGSYSGYFGLNFSKEFKRDTTFSVKVGFRPNLNLNRNITFNNGQRLIANSLRVTPRINAVLNFREMLTVEPVYSISINENRFNIEGFNNTNFLAHNAQLKTTTYWPKNVVIGNDLLYTYNSNVGPGFEPDALLWNISVGLDILKGNGTIKLLGYDILNQNINTRRTAGADFIRDTQGTVLTRYFMASFSYKFDRFGTKKGKKDKARVLIF